MAGNVATASGARALIDAGADAVKVGIGPGAASAPRGSWLGVGVPQLTAIMDAAGAAGDTPVIADGGIKFSGDFAERPSRRAQAAPWSGSAIAGTDESPGEVILYQGRSFKSYRGMGSLWGPWRAARPTVISRRTRRPTSWCRKGSRGRFPIRDRSGTVIHQLVGGLRAAMGYTGCATVDEMRRNCQFVRITGAGLKESHVHDVQITRESPNYRLG